MSFKTKTHHKFYSKVIVQAKNGEKNAKICIFHFQVYLLLLLFYVNLCNPIFLFQPAW